VVGPWNARSYTTQSHRHGRSRFQEDEDCHRDRRGTTTTNQDQVQAMTLTRAARRSLRPPGQGNVNALIMMIPATTTLSAEGNPWPPSVKGNWPHSRDSSEGVSNLPWPDQHWLHWLTLTPLVCRRRPHVLQPRLFASGEHSQPAARRAHFVQASRKSQMDQTHQLLWRRRGGIPGYRLLRCNIPLFQLRKSHSSANMAHMNSLTTIEATNP